MGKHDKTRRALFATPTRANIAWSDVIALLRHLGATVNESAEGSRVGVVYRGMASTFHSPHPGKETSKATAKDVRAFIQGAEDQPAEGEG